MPQNVTLAAGLIAVAATLLAPANARAIFGGRPVPRGGLRFAASVVIGRAYCSGTLVAPRLVLTARHCLPGDGSPLAVGAARGAPVVVGNPNAGGLVQFRRVLAVELPASQSELAVDVALLVLDRSSRIAPATLPGTLSQAGSLGGFGTPAVAVGFGVDTSPSFPLGVPAGPREAAMTVVPCSTSLTAVRATPQTCARPSASNGIGSTPPGWACHGDSGGPLLAAAAAPGALVLLGVVSSFMSPSGGPGCPSAGGLIATPVEVIWGWLETTLHSPLAPPAHRPAACERYARRAARDRAAAERALRAARREHGRRRRRSLVRYHRAEHQLAALNRERYERC